MLDGNRTSFPADVPFEAYFQWPFHDPKMKVPTIYKAYVRLLPSNYGLKDGTNVPPF